MGWHPAIETVSEVRAHGGTQGVYRHASGATGTPMTFALFVPDPGPSERMGLVTYLSGLTCTHANVMEKGEYRAACAEHRLIFLAPDTSPRGEGVADAPDGAWDLGLGAGFYVDATQAPWAPHYAMRSYIRDELAALVASHPAVDAGRQAIMGHSMGGHGALTLAATTPGRWRSVSAFAPIANPSAVPWGKKAFSEYLGPDPAAWAAHDSVELIRAGHALPPLLVDQGGADQFLDEQLGFQALDEAVRAAGLEAELRLRPGYDHSYYFISTFMAEHLAFHARQLKAG